MIAIAGASARMLASAAVDEGCEVWALDLFGDADTRARALGWWSIADPADALAIDPARLQAALRAAQASAQARGCRLLGWIPCAPLEGQPALLAALAAALPDIPLLGSSPAAVRRLRDPWTFFADLAAAGVDHPPVASERPADGQAWLLKDLLSCGGDHIRRVPASRPAPSLRPGQYLQRRAAGQPMSATLVFTPAGVDVLGFNRQIVVAAADGQASASIPHADPAADLNASPYRFVGVVGPVPVSATVAREVQQACDRLAALWGPLGLRGLASLDFLLQGDRWQALELNPRPSASTALYPAARPVRRHLAACRAREDKADAGDAAQAAASPVAPRTRGWAIVHARQPCALSAAAAAWLQAQPSTHDLPLAGQRFRPGDPLCSVSAEGADARQVLAALATRRTTLLQQLETCPA